MISRFCQKKVSIMMCTSDQNPSKSSGMKPSFPKLNTNPQIYSCDHAHMLPGVLLATKFRGLAATSLPYFWKKAKPNYENNENSHLHARQKCSSPFFEACANSPLTRQRTRFGSGELTVNLQI